MDEIIFKGKLNLFLGKKDTPNSRLNLFSQYTRYSNPSAIKATQMYLDLAKSYGLTLTELSLAFCYSRDFMGSTIIGATTKEQLIENVNATKVNFTDEMNDHVNKIHELIPNPSP